jgi:DNA-binding IclR family transcriptional regulator
MSSVYNSLEILDLLSQHEQLGVSEISKETKIGKASVFRMLYTLEKKGYVHKTTDSKYKLGIKFAHFGSIVLEKQNIFRLIRPFLRQLRDKHKETTHLGILDEDLNVIFMVKEASNTTMQMASKVGYKLPFHATAMGKIMIANKMDDEIIIEKLKNYDYIKYTENTIVDYNNLMDQLTIVKEQGYGVDNEESEYGLVCFAAPIKDLSGQVIAAISISGTYVRMLNNKEELINSIKQTAYEVSTSLGYKE